MTGATEGQDGRDEELLAGLFDDLLQQVLDGRSPDLAALLPDRPDLQDKIREAWSLACSVAGRHEPTRPVLGGYQIVRELGRGGMGTVYLARHQQLDREVAIKILPQSLALSPRAKRRFLDEARAIARLRHDHVVGIHRIVDHADMLAFEMEYIDGPSLQQLIVELRERGPAPTIEQLAQLLGLPPAALGARTVVEFLVRAGIAIARALAEVHRNGLVHRDVKPSNILLRKDGRPVLADFGLARDGDLAITQTGAFAGTPIYAAPERLRDGDLGLDGRADVYSLGVTLYEAIALTPPYRGRSTAEVLGTIERGAIPPLRRVAPHATRDLETVIAKAMELQPKDRYASAAALADDLERLLGLQPVHARPAGALRRLAKAARRHKRVLLGGVAGALLVSAGLWPVIANAGAADRAEVLARAHTRSARLHLLSPECQQFGARLAAGDAQSRSQAAPAVTAQIPALAAAAREYEQALAATPGDQLLALEQAVVQVALWLRTASPSSAASLAPALTDPELQRLLEQLPPLCRGVAGDFLRGEAGAARVRAYTQATAPDRFATGLLAQLLGDLAVCDAGWSSFPTSGFEHPLLDAGRGFLFAADGFPERAYPRLFHAAREFPESKALARELAEAALAMGDVGPARHWLEQAPPGDDDGRLQLLAGDLALAEGDADAAEAIYVRLVRRYGPEATTLQRLAKVALHRDDAGLAHRYLSQLLVLAPGSARAHLAMARLALQQRDLPTYLVEARHALANDLGRNRSRGEARDLAEILQLGGLHRLLPRPDGGDAAPPAAGQLHGSELPLAAIAKRPWLPHIAAWLEVLATFDRSVSAVRASEDHPLAVGTRALFAVLARHRGVASLLPAWARIGLASATQSQVWQLLGWLELQLLPFQRSLGDPLVLLRGLAPLITEDSVEEQVFGTTLAVLARIDGSTVVVVGSVPTGHSGTSGSLQLYEVDGGRRLAVLESDRDDVIFGRAIANVGDLDGDGNDDLAVGEPLRSGDGAGRVSLRSGHDGAVLRQVDGSEAGFGVALAGLGDLDGDQVPDYAIGTAPGLRNALALGGAAVYSGATDRVLFACASDRAGVWFGAAVGNAGDVDGDGCDDLIVGGNLPLQYRAPGLVRVYSGKSGAVLHSWSDDAPEHEYGARVAGAGDVDGDGHADLLVAAPGTADAAPSPGRVLVYSGRTWALLATVVGDSPADRFGSSLCSLPDWRGDRRAALAIGAVRGGPSGGGYVRVFDQRSLRPLRSFFAVPGSRMFGNAIADPGVDARGRQQLLVSCRLSDSKGLVWCFREP